MTSVDRASAVTTHPWRRILSLGAAVHLGWVFRQAWRADRRYRDRWRRRNIWFVPSGRRSTRPR